jgi:hypothetical protein
MCLCRRAQTLYGGRTAAASIDRNATRIGNAQGWELKAQSPTRISGSVVITIAAGLPDRRRCDADTLPKAILDLLVAHQGSRTTPKPSMSAHAGTRTSRPGRIVISVVSETRRRVYCGFGRSEEWK